MTDHIFCSSFSKNRTDIKYKGIASYSDNVTNAEELIANMKK